MPTILLNNPLTAKILKTVAVIVITKVAEKIIENISDKEIKIPPPLTI